MAERIYCAGVIGGGVMGSAIAAHLAGAGIRVHLLDIVPPNLKAEEQKNPAARNRFADNGLQNALKAKPAAFFNPQAAALIKTGNLEDHLDRLKECDLIIEAVLERMDVKQTLFARVATVINKDAILASNTSGLSIVSMTENLPKDLQERFVVMHFFNPVRYMQLLEIVSGPVTRKTVVERAAKIGEMLGKGIVYGKDTTNFVANRIGVHGLLYTMHLMQKEGYTIEEVDKIVGKPMGRPSSAAFRTGDVVGIDTFIHVAENCYDALTKDEEREVFLTPDWLKKLVASGRTGQKTAAGFYKKVGKDILVLDVATLDYRPQNSVRFDSLGAAKGVEEVGPRLKGLVAANDRAGTFAWKLLSRSLIYSANRMGEIADDVVNIDRAMRWGFNWQLGPFAAWDAIGVPESVDRMHKEGMKLPAWVVAMLESGQKSFYAGSLAKPTYFDVQSKKAKDVAIDAKQLSLARLHEQKKIVKENLGASLVDLGDGCLCLEVHTKMNTIDGDVIELLKEGVSLAEKDFSALVIGNDGEHFGAGANLMLVFLAAQNKDWDQIKNMVNEFQNANQVLRYAKVPVVAAPFQYTFGGACEITMSCAASQAAAETYIGLVEVGVGLIPGGGGCLRSLERWTDAVQSVDGADLLPHVGQASQNIAMATVSTGAEDGKRLRYLLPSDGVSLNRDHLLYEAKARALGLANAGYRPPLPKALKAPGLDAAKTIAMRVWGMVEGGFASEHDGLIAKKIAHILCGGNVAAGSMISEQHILDLECEAFLALCSTEKTQARMQSILMSNKPLRN